MSSLIKEKGTLVGSLCLVFFALAKRVDDMSFIFLKANDMLSSYLVFDHQRGGWKIQPGVQNFIFQPIFT
jgi:hypothetical protein